MLYNRITLFILLLSLFQGSYIRSQNIHDRLGEKSILATDTISLFQENLKSLFPENPGLSKERKNEYPLHTPGISPALGMNLRYDPNEMHFLQRGRRRKINYGYIVPAGLLAYGAFETIFAGKFRLGNYAIGHEVQSHVNQKIRIDDLTQYVPAASVYALNLAGVKGKNNFTDRTIVLGLASAFTAISVNSLKYTARVERPDGSARNSFPSGHTALAFMGADFLWQEYKDVSIWYGVAGYTIATGTGALRIFNNKHWVGDVAAGAGLGILSTRLAYLIQPAISKTLPMNRKNKTNIAFAPSYNGQQAELAFTIGL